MTSSDLNRCHEQPGTCGPSFLLSVGSLQLRPSPRDGKKWVLAFPCDVVLELTEHVDVGMMLIGPGWVAGQFRTDFCIKGKDTWMGVEWLRVSSG